MGHVRATDMFACAHECIKDTLKFTQWLHNCQ